MTYYFDVTELIGIKANSGIQRVVREVTRRAAAAGRVDAMAVEPVVAVGGRFHRLAEPGQDILSGRAGMAGAPPVKSESRMKAALRHLPAVFSIAQQFRFEHRLRAARALYEVEPVRMTGEDTIVLVDSFWGGGSALRAATAAKRSGAKIVLVVYDLIPISHPGLVSLELAHAFPRAIRHGLALSDGVVTISRSGTREVLDFVGPAFDPARVSHFYLGHDFNATPAAVSEASEALPSELSQTSDRIYLMVGTIEPRKGHDYVLDAFDRLWSEGGTQKLVVIGKIGSHSDAFMARCASHPQLGTRLILIHNASDKSLAAAMARTDALIMASSLEGFGLPLVEALSANIPVLASDIAVFQEIAGDAALFFHCGDAQGVAAAIRTFEADPERYVEAARAFRWIDWDDATAALLSAIERVLVANDAIQAKDPIAGERLR